ncbi:MAG: peptidoglycan-binding protein [Microscillaceae bacterium]|nr:peptidoglycan-binding protein [Microscillaceae bacterium]
MAKDVFRLGDRDHPEIAEAQRILAHLGLYPFAIDSIFGYGTYWAVIVFQQNNQLQVDGDLGPLTLAALRKIPITPPQDLYEIANLREVMKRKAYVVREAQYKLNMVGIRKDDVYDNAFSDRLVVFWINEKRNGKSGS